MKELLNSENQKSLGANQRTAIFISHATPDDNKFTAWLSAKLMALGYTVWCDLFNLPKGCVFWDQIETQIRDHSCVFIPVLSTISNRRDGVLKEIAVAEKTQKKLVDDTFICPLRIDQNLSYDDINVSLVRSNIIDFSLFIDDKNSFLWTTGFVPRLQTALGLEVPSPIHIAIDKGDAEISIVTKDILALTKLNYNACQYGDHIPVTLRFADKIGEILTAYPKIKTPPLAFKYYI